MDNHRRIEEEQERIKNNYVTNKEFEATIPNLQRVLDEVRGDIKKLLVVVHNSNHGKKSADN